MYIIIATFLLHLEVKLGCWYPALGIMNNPLSYQEKIFEITASIGITEYPRYRIVGIC